MTKTRCLIIAPRFPFPVIGGDRLRIYQVAKHLRTLGYEVDLACLCASKNELTADFDKKIFTNVKRVYLSRFSSFFRCIFGLFSKFPLQTSYYRSGEFEFLLSEIIDDYDFVLVHLVRMMPYVTGIEKPVILEMTDAISLNYSRINLRRLTIMKIIYLLERSKLLRYEKHCISIANKSFVVSSIDRDYLVDNGAIPELIDVAGNGVELHDIGLVTQNVGLGVAFVGNMNSAQNQDAVLYFIREILPNLREVRTEIFFKVIGRAPKKFADKLTGLPGVTVTGEVDDIAAEMGDCVAGVCPMQIGAGVQNKILDYFCNGLPVVTTTVGAEGIDASDGKHFLIADTPEKFAHSLTRILNEKELSENLAYNALKLVAENYHWSKKLKNYTRYLDGLDF